MTEKTALISGGTRGIGLAVARELARRGFAVATFARTAEEVDTFEGKMAEAGSHGFALRGDARDDAFLGHFVAEAKNRLGPARVLVNNAGTGKMAPALEADWADWDATLAVNLRAALLLTKLCLPDITAGPGGAIVNVASVAGKTGFPDSAAYCASKFGLVGFSQALFEDVRESGTKVCAICPGYVDTPLIPKRKSLMREEMIRPEDVARAVALVLDASPSACPVEIVVRPQRNPFRK